MLLVSCQRFAIPKLAPMVSTAKDGKAKSTIAAVRSAISTERQKRILRGDVTDTITDLQYSRTWNKPIFDYFDNNNTLPILEYPIRSCKSSEARRSCWASYGGHKDRYYYYGSDGKWILFTLDSRGHFDCNKNAGSGKGAICRSLTE